MRRIVVTGMGAVSPLACGVELSWRRLLAGAVLLLSLANQECVDVPAYYSDSDR